MGLNKVCFVILENQDGLKVLYMGNDAEKAKDIYRDCDEEGVVGLLIRPPFIKKKNEKVSIYIEEKKTGKKK